MNVGEIKIRVKRQFGDEHGVLIDDADLIRWIDDGQVDVVRKTHCLAGFYDLNTEDGTELYDLPADFLFEENITADGLNLNRTSFDQLNINAPNRANEGGGTPTRYYIRGLNLGLYPIPSSEIAIKIFYVHRPSKIINDDDVPEVPVQLHTALVSYALAQARIQNEDESGAQAAMARYETSVNMGQEEVNNPDDTSYPAVRLLPGDD